MDYLLVIGVENPAISHSIDGVRALTMKLEGERVFVWADWLHVLRVLALYNAECRWYDAVRRMNTARKNAMSEVW